MNNVTSAETILVRWTNHDYFSDQPFADLTAAVRYAQSKGFEAAFYRGIAGRNPYRSEQTLLGAWSIIGGYRSFCLAGDAGYRR